VVSFCFPDHGDHPIFFPIPPLPLFLCVSKVLPSDHGDHPITRDHPIFPYSSASSVPLCFKGFAFPITAITRDVGDYGDPPRQPSIPQPLRIY
jgi:hypothetical protein